MSEPQVLSYGGGRQTVAMSILVARGMLPKPDRVVVADTGRENPSTWEYLDRHTRPLLAEIGLEVEVAPHTLATVDIYSHKGELLIPVHTPSGKFRAFCSNEWKAYVNQRYLAASGMESATFWIGFAIDESRRIKAAKPGPWRKRYPLTELMLTKRDCRQIIEDFGWPMPEVSSCWMCPNKHNSEWRVIRDCYPQQWEEACKMDEELRADDIEDGHAGVYLHHSRVPLRIADLNQADPHDVLQCGLGNCFI